MYGKSVGLVLVAVVIMAAISSILATPYVSGITTQTNLTCPPLTSPQAGINNNAGCTSPMPQPVRGNNAACTSPSLQSGTGNNNRNTPPAPQQGTNSGNTWCTSPTPQPAMGSSNCSTRLHQARATTSVVRRQHHSQELATTTIRLHRHHNPTASPEHVRY